MLRIIATLLLSTVAVANEPPAPKIEELREESRIVRARLSKALHGTTIRVNWQRQAEIESELKALGESGYQAITGSRKAQR